MNVINSIKGKLCRLLQCKKENGLNTLPNTLYKYYKYDEDKQRKLLLEELNSYGFDFKETDLGLDKLRTLYYKKKMFSENQNA